MHLHCWKRVVPSLLRCSVRSELGSPRVSTLLEAEGTFPAPQERARLPLPSQAVPGHCVVPPVSTRQGCALRLHLENATPAACCGQLGLQDREAAFILLQNYKAVPSTQNLCFLVEVTESPKFANPGRKYRTNPYPPSMPSVTELFAGPSRQGQRCHTSAQLHLHCCRKAEGSRGGMQSC